MPSGWPSTKQPSLATIPFSCWKVVQIQSAIFFCVQPKMGCPQHTMMKYFFKKERVVVVGMLMDGKTNDCDPCFSRCSPTIHKNDSELCNPIDWRSKDEIGFAHVVDSSFTQQLLLFFNVDMAVKTVENTFGKTPKKIWSGRWLCGLGELYCNSKKSSWEMSTASWTVIVGIFEPWL